MSSHGADSACRRVGVAAHCGQRAAAIMSLVRSAQLNGHDPYAYLKDVLKRLPTQRADQIGELLPHHWVPAIA